jgi:hypothetical protein
MLIDEQLDNRVEVFLRVLCAIGIDPIAKFINVGTLNNIWAAEDVHFRQRFGA